MGREGAKPLAKDHMPSQAADQEERPSAVESSGLYWKATGCPGMGLTHGSISYLP